MTRAAIYARVSSERQERAGTINSQIEQLRAMAAADGHVLSDAELFIDDGVSGTTLLRPALERLRDRVFDGIVEVIYVLSPDRLARRYAYQALLLDEFARRGAQVRFVQGPSGGSPEDELLVQVQGVIAEYERAKILERSRRGKAHKARTGALNVMSGAPFGYRYVSARDGGGAQFQIDLENARTVRRVFDEFTNDLKSIRGISAGLKADGVPMAKGGLRWGTSSVWRMLTNPAYKGQAAWGKTQVAPRCAPRAGHGRAEVPRRPNSSAHARPRDQWVTMAVPPLVSEASFDRAQELLARNHQLPTRTKRLTRFLVSGLVLCAECGYAACGCGGSRTCIYTYYRCGGTQGRHFGGTPVCNMPMVRANLLDEQVWQAVKATLQDPHRVLAEWTRRNEDDATAQNAQAALLDAERVLATNCQALVRLQDAYEAQALTLDELRLRTDRVRDRIGRAEMDVDAARAALHSHQEIRLLGGQVERFAEQVRDRMDEMSFEERQKVVRLLIARVEIGREGVTVVFRLPKPPPSDDTATTLSTRTTTAAQNMRKRSGRARAQRSGPATGGARRCQGQSGLQAPEGQDATR